MHFAEIKNIDVREFQRVTDLMSQFNSQRTDSSYEQIWRVQHDSVYSVGRHYDDTIPNRINGVPVQKCNRAGKMIYHGPGQVILYLLLDLNRTGLKPRQLVRLSEKVLIDFFDIHGVRARTDLEKPGIYIEDRKVAFVAYNISGQLTSHGLCLNHNVDTANFSFISTCGNSSSVITNCLNEGLSISYNDSVELLTSLVCYNFQLFSTHTMSRYSTSREGK